MKIVCDACEAKYSISDDKVRGKVFKIRCKKCSNVIVVRGVSGAEPEPPSQDTRVQHDGDEPAASDAIWHLVIQQEQIGPMTAGDVGQRFATGEINGETFAWREGQADWLPLAQLEAFASLVVATAPVDSILPVAIPPRDELFASAPASEPNSSAQRMRGERNESSVLFSLGNLANIAGHSPKPAPSTIAAAMTPAGGEGSGLIDIRSMASAYLGGGMQVPKPTAGIGSIDDLPVFGGGGFSEPAVLVPTPVRAGSSKVLYAMIGAIALLAVVAAALIVMLFHRDPALVQVADVAPAIAPQPKPAPPPRVPVAVTEPSAPVVAPVVPPPPPHALPPQHHDLKPPAVHATAPVPKPEALAVKPAKPESAECDDISCVVNADSPCCMRLRGAHDPAKPAKPAIDPNLPDKLAASMITDALAPVKARVSACGDKSPVKGRVKVHVKVGPDGHVSNVTVETSPDTKLGACVAAAVQRATFPKTQTGGSFGIPYLL